MQVGCSSVIAGLYGAAISFGAGIATFGGTLVNVGGQTAAAGGVGSFFGAGQGVFNG